MMTVDSVLSSLLLWGVLIPMPMQATSPPTGILEGRVLALPDSQAVAGAMVQVDGQGESRVTDADGRFRFVLPPGSYRLRVEAYGFAPEGVAGISINEGETILVTLLLEPRPFELAEMVVSPSTFGILREGPVPVHTLTRQEVEASPHIGSDLFRAMNRLPGIATHDISSKLHVRGGPDDQVLTLLDGLELYEPYHMKYWDGSLSVIDPEAVGSVDLLTGGFPAEYGDRLTGVMSVHSLDPGPEPRTALGVSAMNASLFSSGGFHDGKGMWLVLARRGFLKYVFAVTGVDDGGELEPNYWDVFGKSSYQVAPGHTLTAHVLVTGETLRAVEEDSTLIHGSYGSSYGWITWDATLKGALSLETILSAGSVSGDRKGEDEWGSDQALTVRDQRSLAFSGISQKWSYQPTENLLLRWGGALQRGEAEYSYYRRSTQWRPNFIYYTAPPWSLELNRLALAPAPSGTEASAFVSGRRRIGERVTGEIGLRYDHITYTGDRTLSPRVGVAVEVDPRNTLRLAWGHYHQSQGLHELSPGDADTTFFPAARAEHRIVGWEHRRPGGTSFRIEAYQRLIRDPRPEYRTLVPEVEGLWEESISDRARVTPERSRAMGAEVMGRGRVGEHATWAASYALASSEDEVEGEWVPRPMDQRHTLNVELAIHPRPSVTLSWAWTYHSPWPYTRELFAEVPLMNGEGAKAFQTAFGPLNDARMPSYHRLDFRATKRFDLERGSLSVFLDVFNAYNRENPYSVITHAFWRPNQAGADYLDQIEPQLAVLPTLGLRWEF
ncbi:MAG: TonB-dependent receptor [Gemmatimonadota bacterium]|jgi:outer membrane receptor protein involved in Fe transport